MRKFSVALSNLLLHLLNSLQHLWRNERTGQSVFTCARQTLQPTRDLPIHPAILYPNRLGWESHQIDWCVLPLICMQYKDGMQKRKKCHMPGGTPTGGWASRVGKTLANSNLANCTACTSSFVGWSSSPGIQKIWITFWFLVLSYLEAADVVATNHPLQPNLQCFPYVDQLQLSHTGCTFEDENSPHPVKYTLTRRWLMSKRPCNSSLKKSQTANIVLRVEVVAST